MKRKVSLGALSFLLIALLAVVPVGVLAAYLITGAARQLENTARQTVDVYIGQFTDNAESTMRALQNSIFLLTTDHQIQAMMQAPMLRAHEGLAQAEASAVRIFSNTGGELDCVTGILIIQSEDIYFSALQQGIYAPSARRAITVWKEFPDINSARSLVATEACPGYCYLVADYLNFNTMEPLGKIVIELDSTAFMNTAYIDSVYNGANIVLSDLSGNILFGNIDNATTQAVGDDEVVENGFLPVDEVRYYHSGYRLGNQNLRVDVFVPESDVFSVIRGTTQIYVIVTVAVLLFTLCVGVVVFTLLTRPLRGMVTAIDTVASGDLDTYMPPTPYRETERISSAFNNMTDNLQELFEAVYLSGVHLREAEFKMLEAQINPHFIFNVLEVINMRAMAAGQEDICRMVTNLAQLLRSNIASRNQQKITFGQELEYVRFYLELQKERFEDALQYEVELEDDGLTDLYLPKLTIQPLVENSIVHGLENKRGGGLVSVHIWEEESGVFIRVLDDGVGFDANKIDFEGEENTASDTHNHVALFNINRRIQLLYGKEYGLTVITKPGCGSSVTVRLPVDKGEKEDAIC